MKLPNNQSENTKMKILNKLLSKEFISELKIVLTDFYRIYLSLIESYSELEDIFSNIIQISKQVTNESYNLRQYHVNEYMKIFIENKFLKLIITQGKKFTLPEVFKQTIEKIENSDNYLEDVCDTTTNDGIVNDCSHEIQKDSELLQNKGNDNFHSSCGKSKK